MGALGRVVLVPAAALTFLMALVPVLAVGMLGTLSLTDTLAGPQLAAAAWHGAHDAALGALAGWATGVLAALGIWGGRVLLRRMVLGAAWVVLLVPQAIYAQGLERLVPGGSVALLTDLVAQAAPSAGLVLLIMTSVLNRLDPQILRSAASSGASPLQVWLNAMLPALAWPLALAGAAALALCLGQPQHNALLSHPTLGGLLGRAIRQHDVAAAPEALLLAGMALTPLLPLALLAVLIRRLA